jgi:predicted GH43/DUF377 family glycosyl hydrolase
MRAVGCSFVAAVVLAAGEGWMLGPFVRPAEGNPVIRPRKESTFLCPMRKELVHWEALHTFNPAAVVRNGKIYVLYRAEDDTGSMMIGGHTSRIGLAESTDGIHFTRRAEPVLYPADDSQREREWPGGCEDPRIAEAEDGTYVLTYTQWNLKSTDEAVATSRDLIHWTKHGPMFANAPAGSYKSAGIVQRREGDRMVATKINGTYWMYWGEGTIRLARSTNLIDWVPVEGDVLKPRPGKFDSSFPESGPPPILTERGILVIYNGKNSSDPELAKGSYAAGQALFDAKDPGRLLERSSEPFFKPEMAFEKAGQYAAGTTFTEGLVHFGKAWFVYYGCADSLVGVAVANGS